MIESSKKSLFPQEQHSNSFRKLNKKLQMVLSDSSYVYICIYLFFFNLLSPSFISIDSGNNVSKYVLTARQCAPLAEISPQLRPVYNNWFLRRPVFGVTTVDHRFHPSLYLENWSVTWAQSFSSHASRFPIAPYTLLRGKSLLESWGTTFLLEW